MTRLILLIIFATLHVQSSNAQAIESVLAEVVWVDQIITDGQDRNYRILHSQLVLDEKSQQSWSEAQELYRSDTPVFTPAIISNGQNFKILAWSEQFGAKIALRYKAYRESAWGSDADLSEYGHENLGVSLIADTNNVAWAFWSAHRGGNDDIFYSQFSNGVWQAAQRVHKKNSVADYLPLANFDDERNISVSWKSFSPTLGDYVMAKKVITVSPKPSLDRPKSSMESNMPSFSVLEKPNELTLDDILSPNFLPIGAAHSVHFTNNDRLKTQRIN